MATISCNTKRPWTVEEDNLLTRLVLAQGTNNWSGLADLLTDRTGKQCRERWHNHLNPDIKKGEWTEAEDALIVAMQRQLGNQWAKISKYLPGRSDNAVKNRFHAIIRARASQFPIQVAVDGVYMAPFATASVDSASPVSANGFVPVAQAASLAPQPFQHQQMLKPVGKTIEIKKEPGTFSKSSMFGGFNPVGFVEAANPLQMFSASAWSSSGSLRPVNEVMATMQRPQMQQNGGQNFAQSMCFDQYTDKSARSSSPAPSIMSLSPVTVDEEFLDYWGLSSSKDEFDNHNKSDMCMCVDDDMLVSYDGNGFEFGF
jgi:hypothetical protein